MVFVAVACPILLMLVCCCLFPLNQAGGEESRSSAIDWRNAVDWRNNAPSAATAAKSVRAPLVRLAVGRSMQRRATRQRELACFPNSQPAPRRGERRARRRQLRAPARRDGSFASAPSRLRQHNTASALA